MKVLVYEPVSIVNLAESPARLIRLVVLSSPLSSLTSTEGKLRLNDTQGEPDGLLLGRDGSVSLVRESAWSAWAADGNG